MDTLVSSLVREDFSKLLKDLFKNRMITKETHSKVSALDQHHLEADIKVRYLFKLVCDIIRADERVYNRLVRVLTKLGRHMKDICETLKKDLGIAEGGKTTRAAAGEVLLTEDHMPMLVELLVPGSHRWEELGISLGLPEHVRRECGNASSNKLKLIRILEEWMTGKYKSATLASLKNALASETVGLYNVSENLTSLDQSSEASGMLSDEEDPSLELDFQSFDTEIAEGKSTILEVQVSSSGGESYQWSKDGQPLQEGVDFSGVCSNILYVNRARQGTEGKYSCCVRSGSEIMHSDDINVTVIKFAWERIDLMKLSDDLLQSQIISTDEHNKFICLDQSHVTADMRLKFLTQQVCLRARQCSQVYERLDRVLGNLDSLMKDVCGTIKKELDRIISVQAGSESLSNFLGYEFINLKLKSCELLVTEGKSTVLDVLVTTSKHQSYQWNKDGQPLQEGVGFSGVSSNMLYVNRARQGTEGKYSCCVRGGSETVHSDDINVTVVYFPDKEHLLKFYRLRESEVPMDSWPPVGNTTFINLVLIKKKVLNKMDYYTVRGDMDDIVETKEKIKYVDVFREYSEGALLLVEGRPGSGKTTLVHKVTRDWAIQRQVLQEARMVFLVTLRLVNISGKDKSLGDLLGIFYVGELRDSVEHKLLASGGSGACFILDGLDEYPISKKENSIIYDLIFNKALPFSMVIVASRPVATRDLKKKCKSRVEVIGFTKKQINSYIETYPYSSDELESADMSSKLKVYLRQHPKVQHMCYLPVHAAMICFLFSQRGGSIPQTETKIYEQFIISTLLQHKTRKKDEQTLKSLNDLCGEEKDKFISICQLAFVMINSSLQVVSETEVQVLLTEDSYLGLLTVEQTYKHYGCDKLLSFQHLSVQEYLAAFYLSQFDEEGTVSILFNKYMATHNTTLDQDIDRSTKLYNVCKLYFGLVEYSKGDLLLNLVEKGMRVPSKFLFRIHCALECQQAEFCNIITREHSLYFEFSVLSSFDFMALGYVISESSRKNLKLVFNDCEWDCDGLNAISALASKDGLNPIKTSVFIDDDNDMQFRSLNCLLKQLPSLEYLSIFFNRYSLSNIEHLASYALLSQLKVLKIVLPLVSCSCPEEKYKALTFGSHCIKKVLYYTNRDYLCDFVWWRKCLSYAFGFRVFEDSDLTWLHLFNSSLELSVRNLERLRYCTEVVLVNSGIDDKNTEILAGKCNTLILEILVFDFNRISDFGAKALAECIVKCAVLREFSIQCNCIGYSGAIALAGALAHCSSLRRLDLQGNALGDEGAMAVAKATDCWVHLDLYLHNVNVSDTGMESILDQRPGTNIRKMVFGSSWDSIRSAGEEALDQALSCVKLPAINISHDANNCFFVSNQIELLTGVTTLSMAVTEDTVPILCNIVKQLTRLQRLECHDIHTISTDSEQLLSNAIKTCQSVRDITLRGSHYDKTLVCLLEVLRCMDLYSLDLSSCELNDDCMAILFIDHKPWINLHTLRLANDSYNRKTEYLHNILRYCGMLRHLEYHVIEMESITEILQYHSTLLELKLTNSSSSTINMYPLLQIVANNHLQVLGLTKCRVHDYELFRTMIEIQDGEKLRSLTLADCDLQLAGSVCLSVKLESFYRLHTLDLTDNEIGPIGMICIAEGLQHCAYLQILMLYGNKITSEGLSSIAKIMESCKYLKELDLRENYVSDIESAIFLVTSWQHKNYLKIYLDALHQSLLLGEGCCDSCYRLLRQYNKNDYILLLLEFEAYYTEDKYKSIPKLILKVSEI